MGSATSSASYRQGQFHDICAYLTVVLGNGTVVTCSKVSNYLWQSSYLHTVHARGCVVVVVMIADSPRDTTSYYPPYLLYYCIHLD